MFDSLVQRIKGHFTPRGIKRAVGEGVKRTADLIAPGVGVGLKRIDSQKIGETVTSFAADTARSVPRAALSAGLTLAPKKVQKSIGEINPREDFGKTGEVLLGKKPIKKANELGADTLKSFGAGEKTASKYGMLVGVGLTAADLTPGGSGKKRIVSEAVDMAGDVVRKADDVVDTVKAATKERGFVTSVKEGFSELRGRVGGEYVPRSTDDLAIKARQLIRETPDLAEKVALTGQTDEAVAAGAELIKHYNDLGRKAVTDAEKAVFFDKAAYIANEMAPKLTELGRSVQAASILGRLTPEGMIRFAAREISRYNEAAIKKIPELSGEQARRLSDAMIRIGKMEDGTEKAVAFRQLQDEIAAYIPSPTYKKMVTLWKAGLLTGVKTSGLNTFANLFHGVSEVVKDAPAAAVDSVASLFTGQRTKTLTTQGLGSGTKEGFQKGWRYFKTGFDDRDIGAKLDLKKVNFGKSKFAKALQRYEETVFRAIGSEDQPFYYGAKARSLYDQAIAQAKNQGIKGAERAKFIEDLVQNPTDDMLRSAVNDAEMSVFQNRTILGEAASSLQKIPGGEVVVPFARTPAAVAMQLINYSPAGIIKPIVQSIRAGKFDQRAFSQAAGRAITGTAVVYIGAELFKKDLISLDYPTNERERNLWELEGRKPNTIKIGDKWRNVNVLGPLGSTLVFGGQYQRALQETGSHTEALVQATAAAGKSLTEQTFLKGINQFLGAITDPERYATALVKNLTGSIIPTIVSDVARATDPYERETDKSLIQGSIDSLKARVPGVRESLPERSDVFGRPIESAGNALEIMIDPSRPSRIKSSALNTEIRRLQEKGYATVPTDIKDYPSLTPEQQRRVEQRAGQLLEAKLENLISSPRYKQLDDEDKSKVINDFKDESRVRARVDLLMELTRGLSRDEVKQLFSPLKKEGFLTESVFKMWLELTQ